MLRRGDIVKERSETSRNKMKSIGLGRKAFDS